MRRRFAWAFRKFLKYLFLLIVTGLLIPLLLFIVLQFPAAQKKSAALISRFLSKKAGSDIRFQTLQLKWNYIAINGLLIKDRNQDTVAFAENARVKLDFLPLLKKNIRVSGLDLSNGKLNLTRNGNDTVFNYSTLFEDTAKVKTPNKGKSSAFQFQISKIDLQNISLLYSDNLSGIKLLCSAGKLDLKSKNIDLDNLIFSLENITGEQVAGKIVISESQKRSVSQTNQTEPIFLCDLIKLKNCAFSVDDRVNKIKLLIKSGLAETRNFTLSNEKQFLLCSRVTVQNSSFSADFLKPDTMPVRENESEKKAGWTIKIKNSKLINNLLALNRTQVKSSSSHFNPDQINFSSIHLNGDDFFYNDDLLQVEVSDMSARDSDFFELKNLRGKLKINKKGILAEIQALKTSRSNSASSLIRVNYLNKSDFKVEARLMNCFLHNSDVLYFIPDLSKQIYFCSKKNKTLLNGEASVDPRQITFNKAKVITGDKTTLAGNILLENYADSNKIFLDLTNCTFASSAKDLADLGLEAYYSKYLKLPETFSVATRFKGGLQIFNTETEFKSGEGSFKLSGGIDSSEHYAGKLETNNFNLKYYLASENLPGAVTASLGLKGQGLDSNSMNMNLDAKIFSVNYRKYNWKNIQVNSTIRYKDYEANVTLRDENAEADAWAKVSLKKGLEQYQLRANVKGADLEKLHLGKSNYRLAFKTEIDLKGTDMNNINGNAGIYGIIVASGKQRYLIDSVLFASVNEPGRNEMHIRSPILNINYKGTFAPVELSKEFKSYLTGLFPAFTNSVDTISPKQHFELLMNVHQHPLLTQAIFPNLKAFESCELKASYDGPAQKMLINFQLPKLTYKNYDINDLKIDVDGEKNDMTYKVSSPLLSQNNIQLQNFILSGDVKDKIISTHFISADDDKKTKLDVSFSAEAFPQEIRLKINPEPFVLMHEHWKASADNYIAFRKNDFMIHDLTLSKNDNLVSAESLNDRFGEDLLIKIKNFDPADISNIFSGDSTWLQGHINGEALFKRKNNEQGLVADIKIDRLSSNRVMIGDLTFHANSEKEGNYRTELKLQGENEISLTGIYNSTGKITEPFSGDIRKFSATCIQAFFPKKFSEAAGEIHGKISVKGEISNPLMDADLAFDGVYLNPAVINSRIQISGQNLSIKANEINFNSFRILDKNNNEARFDGKAKINISGSDFNFTVRTNSFLIMNTTKSVDQEFFGRLIADSRISIKGNISSPVLIASIKVKNQSNITFAVPSQMITADIGDGVVVFEDSLKLNRILLRSEKKKTESGNWKNFDLSCSVEFDKKATLRFLIDPQTSDSLVVRGEGVLNAGLDPGGRITLTGLYNISDGTYVASLENLIRKNFVVESGSSVTWNGDPLDATIYINAHNIVRTTAMDLVAGQISEAEAPEFKKRHAFEIDLKLRGPLLTPDITFGIKLAQGESNSGSGMLNSKLEQLNENPSSLNKQVISLLLLNRFTQENPLVTETNPAGNVARTTVGKFLSGQLNQMSSKLIPGLDVNFDVQSYEEYSEGKSIGRTQVGLGVSKQLFNERLSVQVGGAVDVEGQKAGQNSASDIAGDVSVEYKLSAEGTYRLKGFRNNQYAGIIEGQITETGAGFIYVKDFEKWRHLFKKPKKSKEKEREALRK